MKTYTITCEVCYTAFESIRSNSKYCQDSCRTGARDKRNTVQSTCQACDKTFSFVASGPTKVAARKYCSKSCSAKLNNSFYPKRTHTNVTTESTSTTFCHFCGEEFSGVYNQKFCNKLCKSRHWDKIIVKTHPKDECPKCFSLKSLSASYCEKCFGVVAKESRISQWLLGLWTGGQTKNPHILSSTIRTYLLEQSNYECSKCGFNTPHPDDGSSVLEINHIDGNGSNHRPENLEVICPNCHALTSSYRGRNFGNGRPYRYKMKN